MQKIKLTITEPWECSTEIPVQAVVVGEHQGQYLIYLPDTIQIRAEIALYLLAEVVEGSNTIESLTFDSEPVALQMVYSGRITPSNFQQFSLKDFRGGFMQGEAYAG